MLKVGVCFHTICNTYPWYRLQRRPAGASAPGGGAIVSKLYQSIHVPLFTLQKYVNPCCESCQKSRFSKLEGLARYIRRVIMEAEISQQGCMTSELLNLIFGCPKAC